MSTDHRQLYRHSRWANRLMLRACSELSAEQLRASVPGTYGELGRTLAHLVSAEHGYVCRLTGEPRTFSWDPQLPVPPVSELEARAESSGSRLIELAASVPPDQPITVGTGDNVRQLPAWVVLTQAIDHGREHRTHAATILTQLGIEPPHMDSWAYAESDEGRAGS